MKKTLLTLFLLAALPLRTLAYDFSAVAPTGQTLYYNIVNGEAQVTYPFIPIIHWYGHTKPTGDLIIPDSVVHSSSGITYAVTSIRDTTFYNCTGLTSVTLPNSLTTIGKSAFDQCFGLTGTLTIPNSVTSIGNLAFGYCPGLTSVTIGNSVTSIGNGAFRNCTGLTGTLTIPNSVTYIGNDAFRNCTGLTGTLTIPNSVTSIGDYAFITCSGLTSVSIGDSVTSIGNYAFSNCSGLTSATIGTRVTSIGRGAFKDCIALTTVNFNADSSTFPSNVSNRVFMNCPITVLNIGNNVRRIPNHAFYGTPLVSLTIPDSVTSIGMSAFNFCRSLVSLTIGNSVSTIGDSAFFFNDRLSSLTIPNSVTTIGNYAFRRCESMNSVTIGNAVTIIGAGAFQYCNALTSAIIGYSITSIGDYAFQQDYYDRLRSVTILNESAPALGRSSFRNGINFYIPCGSYNSYYNGTGWSSVNRNRLYEPAPAAFEINVAVDDENMGVVEVVAPVSCDSTCIIGATSHTGYHFSHWSNGSTDNPDTLFLTGDSTVTAYFAPNTYTVSAYSNDDSLGYATGGSGLYLDTITLTATITAPHHHFSHWNDGNTDNPRAYCITGDTSFTAFFVVDTHTVTVLSIDTTLGTVSGGGTYTAGSTITLTATAHEGYRFVQWQDGNTDNPRMVTIESDTVYTAIFEEVVPMQQYTVTVNANNDTMGMVYGGGTYDEGTVITLTATANSGYRFVQWQDGTTQNPRTVTVTGDATYTATFEQEVGIEDVESVSVVLAPNPTTGLLHVKSSSEVLRLEVYNLQGSMLHSADGEASVDLTGQAAGTYMMRVVTASGTSVHRVVKR